jgi:hypothetical protein
MLEELGAGTSGGVHVAAELAACARAAGVALGARAALLELRGPAAPLATMTAQLTGGRRRARRPVRVRHGWWQSQSDHRALLLTDARTRSALDGLREEFARECEDIVVGDMSPAYSCIVLAGPLAGPLGCAVPGPPLMAVSDGSHRRILVVPAEQAPEVRAALLRVGRDYGVVGVDLKTTELHRAARRHTSPPSARSFSVPTVSIATGAPA